MGAIALVRRTHRVVLLVAWLGGALTAVQNTLPTAAPADPCLPVSRGRI